MKIQGTTSTQAVTATALEAVEFEWEEEIVEAKSAVSARTGDRPTVDRTAQTLLLNDGRTLAFAEFGPANGRPVIFFHGTPGSRLQVPKPEELDKQGIRLIAFDRPGYGASSPTDPRSISATADDVRQLADKLGLGTFACVGVSGGAPYAAAVAQRYAARVTKLVLANPAANPSADGATRGMGLYNRFAYWMMSRIPFVGKWIIAFETWLLKRSSHSIDSFIKQMPKEDRQVLANPDLKQMFADSVSEGMKQGGAGHKFDNWSLVKHFDVAPNAIRVPTQIYAGQKDGNVSQGMVEQWRQIPGSRTTTYVGEGHLSFVTHWDELLSATQ